MAIAKVAQWCWGSKGGGAPGRLGSLTYCRHDQLSVGNLQGGGGIMP